MKRGIILVGLGYGDEGKGAATDHLCREYKADLVVRYSGGSQCGHNVQLPDGTRHTFSQFGAGTFAGANTYLGSNVIINPYALKNEAEALYAAGIKDIVQRLWIHPRCLVSTIFHQWMNQLRELTRAHDPNSPRRHGSCGHGIGETRSYWLRYGQDAIFAKDLREPQILRSKLELLKQRLVAEAAELAEPVNKEVWQRDIKALNLAYETAFLGGLFKAHITLSAEPQDSEMVIFEGAQGVLLDEYYGFHPHTTWSTVTSQHAIEMAYEMVDEYCLLGLTRTYMTRHGAGPLPSYNKELTARMADPGNPFNKWQGNMRYGYLDIPLLRYAVKACGETGTVDGIFVSHLDECPDQVLKNYIVNRAPFQPRIHPIPNLVRQQDLGELLTDGSRAIRNLVPVDRDTILDMITDNVGPVVGTADGPTHEHRIVSELPFRNKV